MKEIDRYRAALDWATDLVAGVRPAQLVAPTPCPGYDVRALLGHLVSTVRRAAALANGTSPLAVPPVTTGLADDEWAPTHARDAVLALDLWSVPRRLDAEVSMPCGVVPGRVAIWSYLNEALVHGWDLAVATGQPAEADLEVAQATLVAAQRAIPAQPRGGPVPFAAPVLPAPNAGPTERLANWSGHHR
jgi:uncharacterized protein (TIGR03086 family)